MRTGLLCAGVAVIALAGLMPAAAAGLSAAEVCTGAGYRAGTAAFDMCVSRMSMDDPLAALESSDEIGRVPIAGERADGDDPMAALQQGKGSVAPAVRVPARNGEVQSFSTSAGFGNGPGGGPVPGTPGGGPTPGNPPPGGGFGNGPVPPTPPTPPTPPQVVAPFGGSFSSGN